MCVKKCTPSNSASISSVVWNSCCTTPIFSHLYFFFLMLLTCRNHAQVRSAKLASLCPETARLKCSSFFLLQFFFLHMRYRMTQDPIIPVLPIRLVQGGWVFNKNSYQPQDGVEEKKNVSSSLVLVPVCCSRSAEPDGGAVLNNSTLLRVAGIHIKKKEIKKPV